MFKFKNFKEKFVRSNSGNRHSSGSDDKPSSTSTDYVYLDENQVHLLAGWLDQLNKDKLLTITDQNDIVIMPAGLNDQHQQIFINFNDVNNYMQNKRIRDNIINMEDIARILLKYRYVNQSSGQLSFNTQTIQLEQNQLTWIKSILRDIRPNSQSQQTDVELFDGENSEILSIPYELLSATNNKDIVAHYLFQNGNVRYDINSGSYAYRYIQPDILLDEKIKSPERLSQHQLLSFHITNIHVDQQNKQIKLEFIHDQNNCLLLPINWFNQIQSQHFDRNYIIDVLLSNGGIINQRTFVFRGKTFSLQSSQINKDKNNSISLNNLKTVELSLKQKNDLITHYIDLIIQNDGTRIDQTNQLFLLQNDIDGRYLYFTPEHSQYLQQNQFQRNDVIQILNQYGQIKQNQFGYWILYYNQQFITFPQSIIHSDFLYQNSNRKQTSINSNHFQGYHQIIDYMCRHGLVTWDKYSKVIRLQFSDQTLLLPIDHLASSSSTNIDPNRPFNSRQLSQWLLNNSYLITNKPI